MNSIFIVSVFYFSQSGAIHPLPVEDRGLLARIWIKTAENAGLNLVLCSWGFRDEDFLRAQGTEVIIHDPMELFDIMKLQ